MLSVCPQHGHECMRNGGSRSPVLYRVLRYEVPMCLCCIFSDLQPEHSVGDPSLAREHSWISSMNEQLIGRLPAPDTNVEHMLDIVHSGVVSYDDRHQSSHFDGATFFPFDRARRQLMSGTKWYPCRLCSYRSNRSFNFIRHFVQRHSFGRMIQCADCGSVIRKNTFSAHWLQSHSSVGPRRLTAKPATQASASSAAASDDQWCTKVKSEIVTDEELADVVSIDSDHDVSV